MYNYLFGFAICNLLVSIGLAQPGMVAPKKSAPTVKPAVTSPAVAGGIFNQAPPLVNNALIANVSKFYQLQVEGKFRQCIPLVADESQDDYFNIEKSKYRGFEIVKVEYKDNFKKAVITLKVGITYVFHGEAVPLEAPIASNWKLEKGIWKWYLNKTVAHTTPFGGLTAGPGNPEDHLVTRPKSVPQLLAQVSMDKQDLQLSSFEDSKAEILISNFMPGVVTLLLDYELLPGMTIALEKKVLKSGEKTRLLVAYHPSDAVAKPMRRGLLTIEETGASMPFNITFAVPEEVMKSIPK